MLAREESLNQYGTIKNTSNIYYNGSEWESTKCGKFKIIAQLNKVYIGKDNKRHYPYYLCEFEDGTIVNAAKSSIRQGSVNNPNTPSLYGVGYIGQGKWMSRVDCKLTKEYNLWNSMLRVCYGYDKHLICESTAIDKIRRSLVDERWHSFQNFCEDIQHLKNYNNWAENATSRNNWILDKDTLCDRLKIFPKIYSKDTCIFTLRYSKVENNIYLKEVN